MRILFHTTSPQCHSGYGVACRELVTRLKAQGHFIRVATKHPYFGWQEWNGIEICDGTRVDLLNQMIEEEKFNYVFSLWDIWQLFEKRHFPKEKWVAYVPIDTEWISERLAKVCLGTDIVVERLKEEAAKKVGSPARGPGYHIAMSKHGVRELESIDIKPLYVPLGVDLKTFKPVPKWRKFFRDNFGYDDSHFVIGSVGLNYGDDRKGFIPLLRAFKIFHDRHPEARLYLHTHAMGKFDGTINYLKIAGMLGISEWISWPDQLANDFGRIDEDWLCSAYNGMDVFCLPSRGEGFGLPLVEAQACGIPIITTDTTTGPELSANEEWLIKVSKNSLRYLPNNTWRYEIGEEPIIEALEKAYVVWKNGDWQFHKNQALKKAKEYGWNIIFKKNWEPIFSLLENQLKSS